MCEQTFASLIGPFLSQGILTKDDFSDDLIGSGGQVPPVIVDAESKKEPRKILALAYDSWRGDLTQMKNIAFTTLHQEIEARRARHVGAQDDTTGSVLAKVTSILYESQGDMHERRSFLVDGMAVSATDKLQAEVLRASFDSTYSTTALMAARLYLQLERELKKGPVFLDHVKRMLAGLKTGSQSTSPAEIIPLGEELRSWKEVNPQPEGWQVPLRK
jgi:hypothetical protein